MLKKTDKKNGCWPNVLIKKDFDSIIKLYFKKKIEKHYGQEIQFFCKTLLLGLVIKSKFCSKKID